jgi:hypothetical protein
MPGFENSIHDVGQRASTYKHIELTIASALSRWIDLVPESAACAMVGSHAHIHVDHAQLWDSRLPSLWDHDSSTWNIDKNNQLLAVIAQVENDADLATTSQKLETMYRAVLPAALQAYSAHHVTVDPQVDSATVRILQICINNTRDQIEQANDIIARLSAAS